MTTVVDRWTKPSVAVNGGWRSANLDQSFGPVATFVGVEDVPDEFGDAVAGGVG